MKGSWAVVCMAAVLTAAPAPAQEAGPPDDPGLRGDVGDATAPADEAAPRRTARRKSDSLPPLAPYRRAERIGLRGGLAPVAAPPGPSVAALPAPAPRRRLKRDDKPFDPVGLYVGNLRLTPYIEQDVGYATNPFGAPSAGRGSALSMTEIGVGLQSDWSRNALSGSARLGYSAFFQTPGANAPYGSGVLDYRYDVSRDLALDAEGRFNVATQTNAQLGLAGAVSNQLTLVSTYGATLGATQKFGDFSLGLHGTVDRTQYSGGTLSTDNFNDYGLKLRASYRVSEAVTPFVEATGDSRVYDAALDYAGYDRANTGVSGVAGLRLSFSEMLSGEASAGYGERDYRDPRLPNAAAPLFNASLIWAPTPLTTITLKTATLLQDAVVPGASADKAQTYAINLDHALTERIKFGLNGAITTDDYVGLNQTDRLYTLGASVEYHLSREVVLKASATHQQFVSSAPNADYTSDTVLVGVRLQR